MGFDSTYADILEKGAETSDDVMNEPKNIALKLVS